jgi:anti-sigma factor RsiW
MMAHMKTIQFSDVQLESYLNGSADAGLRQAIEASASTDPALADRLMALDPWASVVAEAVAAIPVSADVARLTQVYGNAQAMHAAAAFKAKILKIAVPAGVAIAVAGAILGGLWTSPRDETPAPERKPQPVQQAPAPMPVPAVPHQDVKANDLVASSDGTAHGPATQPPWFSSVADYVRMMTPKTFASAPRTQQQLAAELAAFDGEIGVESGRILALVPELKLQRAEVLYLHGHSLGQLAFLDAKGEVVAICVIARTSRPRGLAENTVSPFKEATLHGLNIVSWDKDLHGYLVIGKNSPEALKALASQLL